jgi:hypothetical protein
LVLDVAPPAAAVFARLAVLIAEVFVLVFVLLWIVGIGTNFNDRDVDVADRALPEPQAATFVDVLLEQFESVEPLRAPRVVDSGLHPHDVDDTARRRCVDAGKVAELVRERCTAVVPAPGAALSGCSRRVAPVGTLSPALGPGGKPAVPWRSADRPRLALVALRVTCRALLACVQEAWAAIAGVGAHICFVGVFGTLLAFRQMFPVNPFDVARVSRQAGEVPVGSASVRVSPARLAVDLAERAHG